MNKYILQTGTLLFALVLLGAGCNISGPSEIIQSRQEKVPPRIFDPKVSMDGKRRVQVSNSQIAILSGDTSKSFPVPKVCENDIDHNVWFGKDNRSVL